MLNCKSFQALVESLTLHLHPELTIIAEWYRMYQRSQESNESVSEYTAVLRTMANYCNFGEFLDETLQNRFAHKLASESI